MLVDYKPLLTMNEFEGLLRQKGYDKISDLDTVIMESQGNISAFPKPENKPLTIKDLNMIKSNFRELTNLQNNNIDNTNQFTIPLILDGNILFSNLTHIQRSKEWLIQELMKQGVSDYKNEVGIAELDNNWELKVIRT